MKIDENSKLSRIDGLVHEVTTNKQISTHGFALPTDRSPTKGGNQGRFSLTNKRPSAIKTISWVELTNVENWNSC